MENSDLDHLTSLLLKFYVDPEPFLILWTHQSWIKPLTHNYFKKKLQIIYQKSFVHLNQRCLIRFSIYIHNFSKSFKCCPDNKALSKSSMDRSEDASLTQSPLKFSAVNVRHLTWKSLFLIYGICREMDRSEQTCS